MNTELRMTRQTGGEVLGLVVRDNLVLRPGVPAFAGTTKLSACADSRA